MIEFKINAQSNQLVIINGLVVTSGSSVLRGLSAISMPKADTALQTLKRILGIRRKKAIVEEEEVQVVETKSIDDVDSEDDDEDFSEEEEEIIDDSD